MDDGSSRSAQERGMAKLPSGRFPFINLGKALDRAQAIFDNDKGGKGLKVPVAFSAWGYSDKSSGGFQTIAALKGYGLLVDEGANDDRAVKLTPDARRYFQTEIESDKETLRAEFAARPSLMAHLLEHWDGGTVDDPVARTYLKTAIGMNEQSARSALGIYKDNLSHLESKGISKGPQGGAENEDSVDAENAVKFGGARVGDIVDWEVDNALCNAEPLRVRAVSEDGEWIFVHGSSTGIPMDQTIVTQRYSPPFPPQAVMDQAFGKSRIPPTLPLEPVPDNAGPLDVNFDMKSVTVSGRTSSPDELQAFVDDLLDLKAILAKRLAKEASTTSN
jgi:hypothetical protein